MVYLADLVDLFDLAGLLYFFDFIDFVHVVDLVDWRQGVTRQAKSSAIWHFPDPLFRKSLMLPLDIAPYLPVSPKNLWG